jgi:hypothetical protein
MKLLDPEEIKKEYPKSIDLLRKFCLRGADLPGLPDTVKEHLNSDLLLDITIQHQRGMYEFFDENEIYVFVARDGDSFGYGIGPSKNGMLDNGFDERREAEQAAFLEAFKQLEVKLK